MPAIISVNIGFMILTHKKTMASFNAANLSFKDKLLLGISCVDIKWYTWGLSLNCLSLWMADSVGSREAGLYI